MSKPVEAPVSTHLNIPPSASLHELILKSSRRHEFDISSVSALSLNRLVLVSDLPQISDLTCFIERHPALESLEIEAHYLCGNTRFYSSSLKFLSIDSIHLHFLPTLLGHDLPNLEHLRLSFVRLDPWRLPDLNPRPLAPLSSLRSLVLWPWRESYDELRALLRASHNMVAVEMGIVTLSSLFSDEDEADPWWGRNLRLVRMLVKPLIYHDDRQFPPDPATLYRHIEYMLQIIPELRFECYGDRLAGNGLKMPSGVVDFSGETNKWYVEPLLSDAVDEMERQTKGRLGLHTE